LYGIRKLASPSRPWLRPPGGRRLRPPRSHPDADPDADRILILFDADSDVDPDYDFLFDADPDFYLLRMRIQIQVSTQMMRILADPHPQHWSKRTTCKD
jgi:hypothetical protein